MARVPQAGPAAGAQPALRGGAHRAGLLARHAHQWQARSGTHDGGMFTAETAWRAAFDLYD